VSFGDPQSLDYCVVRLATPTGDVELPVGELVAGAALTQAHAALQGVLGRISAGAVAHRSYPKGLDGPHIAFPSRSGQPAMEMAELHVALRTGATDAAACAAVRALAGPVFAHLP
jgi:hypothetical protein